MIKIFEKEKDEPKDLKQAVSLIKSLKESLEKLSIRVENLEKENEFSLQKIGIIRFNPFKEVGGNQSFAIALLNRENTGVVITSLYCRGESRVYAKPVKEGKSKHTLSEEEKKAIEKAKEFQEITE